ncbi:gamma-glutamyl-gamma-aminobutyrate hydrolase family protein [Thiospirochaeta perfilievii]|uniref:gamma-glutamyl-gamma-aminobutyrate hydrolase n=1 Tax=Thiospirochaeta perfilievii TaxID=252967 RepID=A0A5C1QCN6_9SPIO|nr:gamma-glutamyl-gamma-aminobutyrate hydrolase family protein [Thiospirochaeta perfilievii]QEN04699.1 gamma-glutamyl-gamma-aminobutyrate hydrolase family protein [Thiospirochaeta perfilievii]
MIPVIGLTAFTQPTPQKKRVNVSYHYIESIEMAGGIPIVIPECRHPDIAKTYLDRIDGLIISGGDDVSPYLYGENPINEVEYFSVERDQFEIALVKGAIKRGIPVFGICRGIQIINVALGGTLFQDIRVQTGSEFGHNPKAMPVDRLYHKVVIEDNTTLRTLFKEKLFLVNSFHHQAIKEFGEGLYASAYSQDGIIEAIEMRGNKFVYGVQWHPEDLTRDYPEFRALFQHLMDLALERKGLPHMYYI